MSGSIRHHISVMILLFSASMAEARVSMNAMCTLEDKPGARIEPFNPTQPEVSKSKYLEYYPTDVTDADVGTKFRIASLSKVLTTHWAMATLGPEYRFRTKVFLTPGSTSERCNLHFEGDGDPYMSRNMLGYVFPQIRKVLRETGCKRVETVSYDEYFRVFLDAIAHQKRESFGWNNPANAISDRTTQKGISDYLQYKSQINYDRSKVGLISRSKYQAYLADVPYRQYSFQSRPLHMMVRDFNKFSSNYHAEVLFLRLGGKEAYQDFIQRKLNLGFQDVEMYNGSGYPLGEGDSAIYNLVSCRALVLIQQDLDRTLTRYRGGRYFQMADVLPVGGDGETYSTFKSLYESSTFDNTLVAKTGSANLAITFSGALTTKNGNIYFATLTRPDRYGGRDVDNARYYIRDLVTTLARRNELQRFSYRQIGNMVPYDEHADLVLDKRVSGKVTTIPLSSH